MWSVEEHDWVCSEGPTVTGYGLRGAVVGCYLPVQVVAGMDEKRLREDGVRVVVMVRRVAVDKEAGGFERAVGIRSRKEWYRHKMSRKQLQLVGMSGQRVQAGGGREVLVEGQEVWVEWTGQVGHRVEGKGQGTMEGNGAGKSFLSHC